MYFVVFISQAKAHKIVPCSWIRGMDSLVEIFFNNGINSNRNFFTFWTQDTDAFDRNNIPRSDYTPNFAAGLTNNFPNEGWYKCKIRRFKCM